MANVIDFPNERLIPAREVEQILGWADGTVGVKKCRGTLPFSYVQVGRNIRFKLTDIHAFIDANTVTPKTVNA